MSVRRIGGMVAGVLMISSVAVYAQRGGPPPERMVEFAGPHRGWGLIPDPESLRRAGASEQQIQTLETFMFEQHMKRIDLHAADEKANLTLEHLMRVACPDEKAIEQVVDMMNQTRGERLKLDIATKIKVKQMLGEDILNKLSKPDVPGGMKPCEGGRNGTWPGSTPEDAESYPVPERSK